MELGGIQGYVWRNKLVPFTKQEAEELFKDGELKIQYLAFLFSPQSYTSLLQEDASHYCLSFGSLV